MGNSDIMTKLKQATETERLPTDVSHVTSAQLLEIFKELSFQKAQMFRSVGNLNSTEQELYEVACRSFLIRLTYDGCINKTHSQALI